MVALSKHAGTSLNDAQALKIVRILEDDIVLLEAWNVVLYELVTKPQWLIEIKALITNYNFSEGILLTLQRWIEQARQNATFKNLIQKLKDHQLNRVADELLKNKLEILSAQDEINEIPVISTEITTAAPLINREMHEDRRAIRPSEVDDTRNVRPDFWIISLVRKAESKNSQHAFIVLEGIQNANAVIWFIDFVSPAGYGIGTYSGEIRIYHKQQGMNEYLSLPDHKNLLYCTREIMQISKNEPLLKQCWEVPAESAFELVRSVEDTVASKKFPKYIITGYESIFAYSSGVTKSGERGHNCFTWARTLLLELDDVQRSGNLNGSKITEYLICATSQLLPDLRPLALQKEHYKKFAIFATFAAVLSFYYAESVKAN